MIYYFDLVVTDSCIVFVFGFNCEKVKNFEMYVCTVSALGVISVT